MSHKWCCMGFEGHFLQAGHRGSAVFVVSSEERFVFVLQHRAINPTTPLPVSDHPLSLVTDIEIRFCPWCGVVLSEYYGSCMNELDRSGLKVGHVG